MKKLLISALLAIAAYTVNAAGDVEKKVNVSLYGFVSNEMYWQSRNNYHAADGLLNFFPMDEKLNDVGEDLNERFNMSMIAINSRIGLNISGPDILGARSSALVEGDFSTAGMCFFLRQGHIDLNWENDKLLLGQTGHPMCTDLMPATINIAIGSPFNALNRSPMIRYDHFIGDSNARVDLTAAAIYQFWSGRSTGPNGFSSEYHHNMGIPEFWAGVNYSDFRSGFSVEAGFDWMRLKPRMTNSLGHKVDEGFNQWSVLLQTSYSSGRFQLRAKSMYGYNMSHLNLVSGYGVSHVYDDGSYEYAPLKASSTWLFLSYGRTWKVGLFGGFMKNLGADEDLVDPNKLLWVYTGDVRNIDHLYRVCPQLEFYSGNFVAGLEFEVTTASYGKTIEKRGTVTDTHNVVNYRIMLTTKYNF